jgi:hypothetical protein
MIVVHMRDAMLVRGYAQVIAGLDCFSRPLGHAGSPAALQQEDRALRR